MGTFPAKSLWQDTAQVHIIAKNETIRLDFETKDIDKDSGEQNVIITAVLIDSLYSIRSQAVIYKTIINNGQNMTINWQWRIKERIHSGDRIELSLQNPEVNIR